MRKSISFGLFYLKIKVLTPKIAASSDKMFLNKFLKIKSQKRTIKIN
jgi:hypothetical protein